MIFANAQREFRSRLCLWANSEWEKEIAESFPNLRLFKIDWPWQTYQFMRLLKRSEQLALARALLERRWPEAADSLDRQCLAEGELLRWKRDDFFRMRGLYRSVLRLEKEREFAQARFLFQTIRPEAVKIAGGDFENDAELRSRLDAIYEPIPPTFEEELAARQLAGEKIEFAKRRTLIKTMKAKYIRTFSDQNLEPYDIVEGEPDLVFSTRCCGWILRTSFYFKRRENSMEYYHDFISEDTYEQEGQGGKIRVFLRIESNLSFCSWLGDGSTGWRYLTESEVEPACDNAIKFCRKFFEVAPKLLKGLELETITGE